MYITPPFGPYEAHLYHLAFGECERSLGVRAYLIFCEKRRFNFEFLCFSIPYEFFKWQNFSKCENSNFSFIFTLLLNSKHYFLNFKTFSLIELPWDQLTHSRLHLQIFIWNSWKTSQLRLKHVSSWSYMKISSCGFMFKLLAFGWIFTFCTWNWLFSLFVKFVSSSIFSTPIHMKSGEKVENISNSHFFFRSFSNTSNFQAIFLWFFTFHGH